jgi:hypothetical protein
MKRQMDGKLKAVIKDWNVNMRVKHRACLFVKLYFQSESDFKYSAKSLLSDPLRPKPKNWL